MLHDMLRAAAATEDRLIGEAKTARLLRKLPLADLYKLATEGTLGGEGVDGDSWVTRFAGTPLAGAATELATQELELETQIAQNRALGEGVLQQKDQLSIQKRLLDIELVRAQTEEAEKAQAAEAEQQQAPPQADDQAAPPDQPVAGTPPGAEVAPPAAPKMAALEMVNKFDAARGKTLGALKKGLAIAHGEYREPRAPDESKVAAITEKALDALKKGLAVDHRAVSAAARRHLEDVDAGSKSPGGEKKVAGVLDTARGLVTRGHELVTGSKVRALEGKAKELSGARDVALHGVSEAEKVLSRGPSIYKGKEILPGPTRETRMRMAREVNEHGATAARLGKEVADTAEAAKTEARKVTGTRVGLVAAPLALGAAAATCATCGGAHASADHPKIAMVSQAISGLLSHPVAGRVANFAIAHPTAAAGIAGGAVGGVGGALSTDAQGKHSLGRVAAGMAGGAAAGAGIQQAYANRGAISEAAQKAVAGIKAKMAPAAAAAAPAAAEAVPAAAV